MAEESSGFEPQKFFIGVIDLFSVLLPGGAFVYAWKEGAAGLFGLQSPYELDTTEHWVVFLFAAYLVGHLVFLFGALLDIPYDAIRGCTDLRQNARLAEGKKLSPVGMRALARLLFKKNPDAALRQVIRLKARALSKLGGAGAINAFQWCKARLSKEQSNALAAVERMEADSKFFRSLSIMLAVFLVPIYRTHPDDTLWCVLLLVATLWRYADQRFKATQQAYWFVLTLESGKIESPKEETSGPGAGAIVYRLSDGSVVYLSCGERILHVTAIEPGESPREAAVRRVQEETALRARVVDWLGDTPLSASRPGIRSYLLEFVRQDKRTTYPEDSAVEWLPYDIAASKLSNSPEAARLLKHANDKMCTSRSAASGSG